MNAILQVLLYLLWILYFFLQLYFAAKAFNELKVATDETQKKQVKTRLQKKAAFLTITAFLMTVLLFYMNHIVENKT